MTIFEKLRLLTEYAPILSFLQDLATEDDPHAKAVIAMDAAQWIAEKTDVEWDEELIEKVAAILKSDEGEDLVRWVLETVKPDDAS